MTRHPHRPASRRHSVSRLAAVSALALAASVGCTLAGCARKAPVTEELTDRWEGSSLYDIDVETLTGEPAPLARYRGRVTLVVNTASKCGFTPQYAGLQRLHERFGDRGFAVLGFPSGDFMNQEFGTADEIAEFCSTTYQVTFPLFAKVRTKPGEGQSPVYEFLGTRTGELPAWNFGKYLVDREGRPIAYWGSRTAPESEDIVAAIETALAGETSAEDAAAAAG